MRHALLKKQTVEQGEDLARERRPRGFAETVSDWFWETGPDLRFTYASSGLKEATGLLPQELIGRSVNEFFDAASRPEERQHLRDAMGERQPFRDWVIPYRTKLGRDLQLRLSGVPILTDHGLFQGYRGYAADITAEVEARGAAQRSDALLRSAIESLTEGFALFDPDERLVVCNLGYRDMFDLVKESVVPGVGIEALLQCAAERGQFQFESAEAWVSERLDRFRNATGPAEERLKDGRYIQFTDYCTIEGGRFTVCIDITARKHSEAALRESEDKFKGFLKVSPDATIIVNDRGDIILASDAITNLFGYSPGELAGKPLATLIPERYQAHHKALTAGYIANPRFRDMRAGIDLYARRKDGTEFPAEVSLSPSHTSDGLVVLAAIRDITERKKAERALRESREGLERAQKIGRIGSIKADLITGERVWSTQQYRLFGFDPAQGGGNLPLALSRVHPDDRQLMIDERAGNERGVEPKSFDYRIVLPSGETRWFRREAELERDAAGRPVALYATHQDITESKQAMQELAATQNLLKDSEARYRSYFESAMDAQFLARGDGSIIEVNAAACEMLGMSAEEIKRIGQNSLVEMSDSRLQAALKERALKGKARAEFTMIRADGTKFPVEGASSIFTDVAGRKMIAASIRDLTERKRIEAQLAQAQKMEALGTLAGGVAHDLNNTLVPIVVFAQLTASSLPEDSTERQYLATVSDAANRAKELVEQILTFSRSDTTERSPIDLARTVRDALKMLRAGILPTTDLRAEIPSEPLPILGNATQIHQVVMNLCTNAAHAIAGKTGKIAVVLRAERGKGSASRMAPAGWAKLSVEDDGVGMEEKTQRRIFDPFFTTRGVGEGTGLGLSIVHSIVAAHGGTIAVESKVGVGSRFELSFPLITDTAETGG